MANGRERVEALPLGGVVFGEGREDREASDRILDRLHRILSSMECVAIWVERRRRSRRRRKQQSKGWRCRQRSGAEKSSQEGRRGR